jgi:hypothetical protein
MARTFTFASSQYLSKSAGVVTSLPFTMAAWVRPDDTSLNAGIMLLGASANSTDYYYMQQSGTTLSVFQFGGGTNASSTVTSAFTNGVWAHVCGVWTSTTSRLSYLNGTAGSASATSITTSGINRTIVGARLQTDVAGRFYSGRIAWPSIWNVALTATEVAALAGGANPLDIRRLSLQASWPSYGFQSPEQDLVGANSLTVNAAPPQSDGPPNVTMYSRKFARRSGIDVLGSSASVLAGVSIGSGAGA